LREAASRGQSAFADVLVHYNGHASTLTEELENYGKALNSK